MQCVYTAQRIPREEKGRTRGEKERGGDVKTQRKKTKGKEKEAGNRLRSPRALLKPEKGRREKKKGQKQEVAAETQQGKGKGGRAPRFSGAPFDIEEGEREKKRGKKGQTKIWQQKKGKKEREF